MIILTLRTDKPEAEVGIYQDQEQMGYQKWQAHRELSTTLHQKIKQSLTTQNKDWSDIQGIICFTGPGSFTGLRIGITLANTIASDKNIPIVGVNGDDWISHGIEKLLNYQNDKIVIPFYGRAPHITQQKK